MKYLIVTGGMTTDEIITNVIKKGGYEVVIAVDSGTEFLYRAGIIPDIIVGDLDSANPDIIDYYRDFEYIDFCILKPEKDDTDTEHAIHEAIRRGAGISQSSGEQEQGWTMCLEILPCLVSGWNTMYRLPLLTSITESV